MQLDPEHVEAAEPLSRALLQARGVGAAGAAPRDAGAQGGPQDQPRADAALSPPGQGGRRAGREREGAQVLQAVLRPRLDLPADAGRSGGAALQAGALGRRVPHLPDDPGPPPRHAEGRRDRRHLLPPRAHQAEARRAHQGGQHVREGAGDSARAPGDARRRSSTSTPRRATSRRSSSRSARCMALADHATRREVHALRGDRRDLQGQAQQPAEGDRRAPRGARVQAATTASCCTTCSTSSARPSSGRRRWRS